MQRIVLVDDHFLVRDGIRSLLEDVNKYEVIGEASNGMEALDVVQELKPDIVICDIRMPEMSGIETVVQLSKLDIPFKTIMLSMHDSDEYILQSINAGADGYLLKDAGKEEFLKALATVSRGDKYFSGDVSAVLVRQLMSSSNTTVAENETNRLVTPEPVVKKENKKILSDNPPVVKENPFELTKRERQILKLAVTGMTNKDIAASLAISKRTTEVHRFNLMKKMGVKNILEMSNKAREFGLI